MSITGFQITRAHIVTALKNAGIGESNISFDKESIPTAFPSAMVILEGESGILKTNKRFLEEIYNISIFLIINAEKVTDPDVEIMILKEAFRVQYLLLLKKDFPKVEYYNARADSGRKVKIAKIYTVSE
jgi:hypothetical protein